MTSSFDPDGHMTTPALDEITAKRLLDGEIGAADAPAGYGELASLLSLLREPAAEHELAREAEVVAAVAAAVIQPPRQRRRGPKRASLIGGVVIAATLLGSGAAAAATGNLPSGVQTAVAHAASHIGLSIPHGHGGGEQGTAGRNQPAGGLSHSQQVGLCTAYLAGGPAATAAQGQSQAFAALRAQANGNVTTYCQGIVNAAGGPSSRSGAGPGASGAHAPTGPAGPPAQTGQGQPAGGPPVSTGGVGAGGASPSPTAPPARDHARNP
jgi:hypothetical protein